MAKAHTGLPVAYDDVLAARETIGDRLHRTPTFSSATLSGRIGGPAALKAELFQRTGSFKPRGMLNVLAHLSDEEKARGVITISAGNAAQALAYCAALEGIDCLVVMWQGSSAAKQAATRGYGAEVDLEATRRRGVRAAGEPPRADRPRLRPLVRRPTPDRRPRNARASRCSRTSPTWARSSFRSGRRSDFRDRDHGQGRASRSASRGCRAGAFAGDARRARGRGAGPGRAEVGRRRAQRAVRRREYARDLPRARGRDGPRLGGADSRRRCASSTSVRSWPASPPEPSRPPLCWPERSTSIRPERPSRRLRRQRSPPDGRCYPC